MPTFETPESINVVLDLSVGYVQIAAGDRADTVVEVRPSDEAEETDVEAARQVRVDLAGGELRVIGPKRTFDFSRKLRSVDVTIELPVGSRVDARVQMGDLRTAGRLGETRLKTSAGNLSVERTGALRLDTSAGHVTAGAVTGDAEISTGTGRVQVGEVQGSAAVKNSNGATVIGTVIGDVKVRAANGDIEIERADAGVDAKTSNGDVRLGLVARGSVVLETGMGGLDVGIAEGTAAWLEAKTGFGHVRNQMDNATGPDEAAETIQIHARTSFGDITVHRS
jgi:DUF4097 and DUF4098 domain-containing protein YvlB